MEHVRERLNLIDRPRRFVYAATQGAMIAAGLLENAKWIHDATAVRSCGQSGAPGSTAWTGLSSTGSTSSAISTPGQAAAIVRSS